MLLDSSGGNVMAFEEFVERCNKGDIGAAWIVGGYPNDWAGKDLIKAAGKLDLLVVQDLLAGALSETATVVLPACSWAERDGSFVNATGLAQPFERALDPPDGARRDGQYLFELAGCSGLYSGGRVREMMAESGPAACEV
jgi:predicted molibdopterin-dependent oxidoreductase YjgC